MSKQLLPTEWDRGVGPPRRKSRTSTPTPKEKTGLFILNDRKTAAADIVAVHGLCGDPFDTWTEEASNKLWLRDFLPSQVPNTRIMSFGYDSFVAFSKSEVEISDVAADLLNRLSDERDTIESADRPVIFICHSLGGIVVKKALILAHERSGAYGGLLERTKGIIFLGTPHRGANAAFWADFVVRALEAFQMGTSTNRNLLSELRKNSGTLWQISQQFVERTSTLKIKTFYETNKLDYMNSLIVEKDSAILNLPSELAVPISADHRSMCKFASKDEQKYRPVWKAVKYLVGLAEREKSLYPVITQLLLSVVDRGGSDQLLRHLPAVDQEGHKSRTQPSTYDQPRFYWIFKDMDFEQWRSRNASGAEVLYISGPAGCQLTDVSSRIVDLAKETQSGAQRPVLYFFCTTAPTRTPVAITFASTVVHQLARCSPQLKEKVVITFLHTLLDTILGGESPSKTEGSRFNADDSAEVVVKKILKASSRDAYWDALRAVLDIEQEQGLSLIIDGLDKTGHEKYEFIRGLHRFIQHLPERPSTTRVLLTSRPRAEIKEILDQLPCMEYDRERKECLNSLRFDNTRYEKISEQHEGSLEWLWTHPSYLAWSSTKGSDLLLIEGKPGSGKSTLMKYFQQSLWEREPHERRIVASFYYSYREGEKQTNHSNMLRSVLYDVLSKNEEFFFHFQSCYRQLEVAQGGGHPQWPYESLKGILLSLTKSHPVSERLYFIVDAMDESDDGGRIDAIELLHELCAAKGPCIAKVFVASRPIVGLSGHSAKSQKMIRLQDVNDSDILKFAKSFIDGPELSFPPGIAHPATEFITKNAQGVFVWVHLVREELLQYAREGYTKRQIFDVLKSLPTELEGIYERILVRLEGGGKQNVEIGQKMLQLVLSAYRPLGLDELRQALAIQGNLDSEFSCSDELFEEELIHGIEKRIISCAGNFLEIKAGGDHENIIVQVMHQTVREFFRPDGPTAQSRFRMNNNDARMKISVTCIRYLMLCAARAASIDQAAGGKSWTSEHFEAYARYLGERPFFRYAIAYAERHLRECGQVAGVSELISQLHRQLNAGPAAYLLEDWIPQVQRIPQAWRRRISQAWRQRIPQAWRQRIPGHEQQGYDKQFRAGLLHAAARMKCPRVVEALLIAGAEVDACLDGKTPLMVAVERGDLATARVLLDGGALIGAKDGNKQTALHLAAANGHNPVVGLLIDRGAEKEAGDDKGQTAMHLAAANGHSPVVGLLIDRSAEKEAKNDKGQTAMHLAAANGHSPVVGLLIDRGAEKEAKDDKGQTAMHLAAANGHNSVVGVLIDLGADKEAKDERGQTALHLVAANGNYPIASLLIDRGAKLEGEDVEERTALHFAAANGNNPIIRLLIDRGANKEAKDSLGWGALHTAAWSGHEATIQMLVQSVGANKEEPDKCGWTVLHVAAMNGCDATSQWLIEHWGADKEAKDNLGWTALHFVAALGLVDTARLLIKTLGVNRDARNNEGKTAQDLAQDL